MFFTLRFSCYAIELNEIIAIIAIVNLAANRICLFSLRYGTQICEVC